VDRLLNLLSDHLLNEADQVGLSWHEIPPLRTLFRISGGMPTLRQLKSS
jgi:hypothetical protein